MQDSAAKQASYEPDDRQQDAEAVARTLAGETAAFDQLIENYQRRAVAVSYRLLGDINDAMDVCQDAFLKAYRSLSSLEDRTRFGPWLLRIVSNLSLNYRRGRRRNLSLTVEDGETSIEDRLARSPRGRQADVSDRMQAEEADDAVTRAVDALPEQQRLALVLFAIEGLPQKEVAEIMECSVEMVKWNVFQARKTLKASLAEYL